MKKITDLGLVFPDIIQDNSGASRVYLEIDAPEKRYPSITTILSATASPESKTFLENWKNRVGEEEADKISRRGRNRGTKVHSLVEDFYMKKIDPDPNVVMPHIIAGFNSIRKGIDRSIKSFCLFEQNLISHQLRAGGRLDCGGFLRNNALSIIDFKTSRRNKTLDDCHDYFIQTALYGIILNEMLRGQNKQIRVHYLTIIMSVDDMQNPLVFIEPIHSWKEAAFDRVQQFYKQYQQKGENHES